ncbi:hypothetical protein AfiDRAFT_0696 [Afipia sp. 1NLS2]|nr:hypothetical protein AfiDRAFT_0696 [Afipia sp. 1NLS2]
MRPSKVDLVIVLDEPLLRRGNEFIDDRVPAELALVVEVGNIPHHKMVAIERDRVALEGDRLLAARASMRIPTSRARSGRIVVFLIIFAIAAATMAWHFYGDQAKQPFSSLVPQFLGTAPAPTPNTSAAEPQNVASRTAAPQPAVAPAPTQESSNAASGTPPLPESAPAMPTAEAHPTQVALPPEITQSLEAMAQEIASLKQAVEQLRAGQQQLSNDVAKTSEHVARHKLAEQASKPVSRQRPPACADTSSGFASSRTLFVATNTAETTNLSARHRTTRRLHPTLRARATSVTAPRLDRQCRYNNRLLPASPPRPLRPSLLGPNNLICFAQKVLETG